MKVIIAYSILHRPSERRGRQKELFFYSINVCIMYQHKVPTCPVCKLNIQARTNHFEPIIKQLCKATCKKRRTLLNNSNECLIKYISDCCVGVLSRKINFPNKFYPHLQKHQNDLLYLAQTYPSIRKKKERLIRQSGGFLSILLPALASSLFGLITNLVSAHR